jgi:hypothetical protein
LALCCRIIARPRAPAPAVHLPPLQNLPLDWTPLSSTRACLLRIVREQEGVRGTSSRGLQSQEQFAPISDLGDRPASRAWLAWIVVAARLGRRTPRTSVARRRCRGPRERGVASNLRSYNRRGGQQPWARWSPLRRRRREADRRTLGPQAGKRGHHIRRGVRRATADHRPTACARVHARRRNDARPSTP